MENNEKDNLQKAFYKMLSSSFTRIDNFEALMRIIETHLFNEQTIQDLINDPQQLLNLYNTLEKKKQSNEYFALKILDLANKNALVTKLIQSIIDDSRTGRKLSGTVDPDVQAAVNLIRQNGLQSIHGGHESNE